MILTVPQLRLVWGGSIGASEIWQCGLTAKVLAGPIVQADVQQAATKFHDRVVTFMSSTPIKQLVSIETRTTKVRAYYVPAGTDTATLVADGGTLNVAGTNPQTAPNQCALVFSLRSQNPGRKGRGRFYLPCLAGGYSASQLIQPAAADLVTPAIAFLNGVQTDLTAIGGGASLIAGSSLEPITSVVVDSVVDTQRRRRNGLNAVYTSTGVVGP